MLDGKVSTKANPLGIGLAALKVIEYFVLTP